MTSSEHTVVHSTLELERTYPLPAERVFAAWADPAAKARWFAGDGVEHELDFRVGGRERVRRPGGDADPELRFEGTYHDIVPGHRIVFAGTLYTDDRPATISLTTVQLEPAGDGTRLLLTEQGTFLDGLEQPSWREQGITKQLDTLATELSASPARS
jgi:uncharacterized protein YndB with AHSA1/START domain